MLEVARSGCQCSFRRLTNPRAGGTLSTHGARPDDQLGVVADGLVCVSCRVHHLAQQQRGSALTDACGRLLDRGQRHSGHPCQLRVVGSSSWPRANTSRRRGPCRRQGWPAWAGSGGAEYQLGHLGGPHRREGVHLDVGIVLISTESPVAGAAREVSDLQQLIVD